MRTIAIVFAGLALACGSYAQEKPQGNPKQEVQELMNRAREAKAAGRTDEARELAAKAHHLAKDLKLDFGKGRLLKGDKTPGPHPEKKTAAHPEKKPSEAAGKKPGPPEKKGTPHFKGPEGERLHHIAEAIGHLRAAGLHEPAKGIEEIARNMHREMEERAKHEQARQSGKEAEHPAAARFHAEMDEMRQQIRKLAEQIEQLHKEMKPRAP